MSRKERITAIATSIAMIVAVCMAVGYAAPVVAVVEEAPPPFIADKGSVVAIKDTDVAIDRQAAVISDAARITSFAGRLTDEQTALVMSFMDGGKIPDLSGGQITDLIKAFGEYFPDGFPDGFGEYVPEQFSRVMAAFKDSGLTPDGDMLSAVLKGAGDLLARALKDGIVTQEFYDRAKNVLETGTIEFSDEQIAEFKGKASGLLDEALAKEQLTQEQYDKIISMLDSGVQELTGEQKEMLQSKLGDLKTELTDKLVEGLSKSLDEGFITQRLYNMLMPGIASGELEYSDELAEELKIVAGLLLTKGYEEYGLISQGLYDILAAAVDAGKLELTKELLYELQAIALDLLKMGLNNEKLTQEQYDWLVREIKIAVIQFEMRDLVPR